MLELYHNDMSTCAQKVRLALAEKEIFWESKHLDLRARDHQSIAYLKLNPNAVVPTLVHDGSVIIESTVINEYIDDAFIGPALRPESSINRAHMRLWTKQLDEGLHADTGVISTSISFRYQKLEKGDAEVRALIENVPDPVKRERVRANIFDGVNSPYFREAILRFDALLSRMEAALSKSMWLAGDQFSLADIAYTPYLTRLEHLQMSELWSDRPHLANWFKQIQVRKSYDIAIIQWLNPKYLTLMEETGKKEMAAIRKILDSTMQN